MKHTGSLKNPNNLREVDVELTDGIRLRDLFDHLLDKTEVLGGREQYQSRAVTDCFFILINGRNCELSGGAEAILRDGNTISLLVPVAGGC